MTIVFTPTGTLNVSTDPSDLPEQGDKFTITSGAMTRCKNLRINELGKAVTRDGSAKLNETAIARPSWLEVQAGVRYAFASQSIYENESLIESTDGTGDWTAIQYNAFNDVEDNIFALNGTDRKRIEGGEVFEWGLEAPTAAPVLAVGSATGLTGTYNAAYTYVRKVGSAVVAESDPSPVGNATALSNEKLTVTVTAPDDDQVTHIRLYRTTASGVTYNYDQEIAVGSTTFTSDTADGSLGDEAETDHDRPPLGEFVIGPAYEGTCFILKDNLLYYCKPKQPEYWPALYYIEVGNRQFPLVTAVFHNGQLYAMSGIELFYIQGTGASNFFPLPMRAKTGAQSKMGAVSVTGKGIYHTGPDGIYFYASGVDTKLTEDTFEPLFRGEDKNGMPGVGSMSTSWLKSYRNHLYFGYASADADYPDNLLVMNLDTGRTTHYTYDDGSPIEISAIAEDAHNKRLLIADATGFIRVIESKTYTDDSGEPIAWDIESKDFMLSTRRHFPRWVKWDVDASEAEEATGEYILSGAVLTSHTLTANRDTRRRLLDTGNGTRASVRVHGSGTVSIHTVEAE